MAGESLHDEEKRLVSLRQRIEQSAILPENKRLLLDFDGFCAAGGLTPSRRVKLFSHLYVFATEYFTTPFRDATPEQVWTSVAALEGRGLAPWTRHGYKVAIRKFFRFVAWGHEALRRRDFPATVAGISIRVKRTERVRIQAADILSEEEVTRLLAASRDVQERALFGLMYELGARVSEVGTMRVGSVARDEFSYTCDLQGKTGPRSPRVVLTAAALTGWLNLHPRRADPAAPLWGEVFRGEWTPLRYDQIRRKLSMLAEHSRITKRVHPHLLRHSRITHVMASGQMNEAQAKVYFGLVPDSNMMNTYAHLLAKDANDAILRMHGITPSLPKPPAVASCGMCGEQNPTSGAFCARCGYVLRQDAADNVAIRTSRAEARLEHLLSQPEVEATLRRLIHDEFLAALAADPRLRQYRPLAAIPAPASEGALPARSAQPTTPRQERRRPAA